MRLNEHFMYLLTSCNVCDDGEDAGDYVRTPDRVEVHTYLPFMFDTSWEGILTERMRWASATSWFCLGGVLLLSFQQQCTNM